MKTYELTIYYQDGIEIISCRRMSLYEAWDYFRNHLSGDVKRMELIID